MTEAGEGALGPTRQTAIDALCEHFANDALSVEEFERRVDAAHKAESSTELAKLLEDLPTGDLPVRQEDVTVDFSVHGRPKTQGLRARFQGKGARGDGCGAGWGRTEGALDSCSAKLCGVHHGWGEPGLSRGPPSAG